MTKRPDRTTLIQILIIIGIIVLLWRTGKARADEPKTTAYAGSAIIYPTSFEGKALTPTVIHSFAAFVPVANRWSLVLKGAMATPTTAFQPAPQAQTGVAAKLAERLSLCATGMYRFVPHRTGTPGDSHVVGIVLGPSIPLPSKIALGFSTGVTRNLTTEVNSFFFGFELAFQLPI